MWAKQKASRNKAVAYRTPQDPDRGLPVKHPASATPGSHARSFSQAKSCAILTEYQLLQNPRLHRPRNRQTAWPFVFCVLLGSMWIYLPVCTAIFSCFLVTACLCSSCPCFIHLTLVRSPKLLLRVVVVVLVVVGCCSRHGSQKAV